MWARSWTTYGLVEALEDVDLRPVDDSIALRQDALVAIINLTATGWYTELLEQRGKDRGINSARAAARRRRGR